MRGDPDESRDIMFVQFAHDALPMILHGADTYLEIISYFFCRTTRRNALQNFSFSFRADLD